MFYCSSATTLSRPFSASPQREDWVAQPFSPFQWGLFSFWKPATTAAPFGKRQSASTATTTLARALRGTPRRARSALRTEQLFKMENISNFSKFSMHFVENDLIQSVYVTSPYGTQAPHAAGRQVAPRPSFLDLFGATSISAPRRNFSDSRALLARVRARATSGRM